MTDRDLGHVDYELLGEAARLFDLSRMNADDLVHVIIEANVYETSFRALAAKQLFELWENSSGGITLDHIVYVCGRAPEPYRTKANDIIRSKLEATTSW
jgi:hypothetical protein